MLEEYTKREKELINDLRNDPDITCKEAQERCKELWKLIPIDYDVNPVALNDLMYIRFHNDPDWNYSKSFEINIRDSDTDNDKPEGYIKKIKNKFKNI